MTSIEKNRGKADDARQNLIVMYRHLLKLYTSGESSSISEAEAIQIANSLRYVLDVEHDADIACRLVSADPLSYLHSKLKELNAKVEKALATCHEINLLMPDIRSVALRDTLASIMGVKGRYDTFFAAHEVPCNIEYQLSEAVEGKGLEGIDYLQAWLDQLTAETQWIAQFTTESCIEVLEERCPDYRGLHVNLYDLLKAGEGQLQQKKG